MAMMNERNNRSWINEDKRIRENLKRHLELMAKYEAQGMSSEDASRKAYNVIMKREAE
jgi:hypothetical protein